MPVPRAKANPVVTEFDYAEIFSQWLRESRCVNILDVTGKDFDASYRTVKPHRWFKLYPLFALLLEAGETSGVMNQRFCLLSLEHVCKKMDIVKRATTLGKVEQHLRANFRFLREYWRCLVVS